jgi:hypothetical protein
MVGNRSGVVLSVRHRTLRAGRVDRWSYAARSSVGKVNSSIWISFQTQVDVLVKKWAGSTQLLKISRRFSAGYMRGRSGRLLQPSRTRQIDVMRAKDR